MPRPLHTAPFAAQYALGIDQEGAAIYPQVFLAIQLLQLDHVEQLTERFVLVADQLEGEFLLALEVLVRLQAVARDAEHQSVGGLEGRVLVAEALALGGAARGAVLRVEVDHYLLALQLAQGYLHAAGGFGGEVGNRLVEGYAHLGSLGVLRAPGLDQRVQVQRIGEVEELIAQPADLGARRQGHGQGGVEQGAAGLRRLVGIAGDVLQLHAVVAEELAEFVEDVRAVGAADVGYIGQGVGAHVEGAAAHHVDAEVVALGQCRQHALESRQGVPAATDLQGQGAVLAVAGEAAADHAAAVLLAGPAEHAGELHGVGAEGADDEELFANRRGGHAAFLKRWAFAARRPNKGGRVAKSAAQGNAAAVVQ